METETSTTTIPGAAGPRLVEFDSHGTVVRGVLRVPEAATPVPLVVLAHGLGGLKEWTIPELSVMLGDAGIATLAFDYRTFGDSDGTPREEVDHVGQIEDWRSAITFATAVPEVDSSRIALWGTSLGGRNALAACALDHRVAVVVAQVPPITGSEQLAAMIVNGGNVEAFRAALAQDARLRLAGGEPRYVDIPNDPATDYGSYWATFGEAEKRNWTPHLTLQSFAPSLADDILPLMPRIAPRPMLLLLTSDDALCSTDQQLVAYQSVDGPKSLQVYPGHHYSLYTTWKAEALGAAVEWFARHLLTDE